MYIEFQVGARTPFHFMLLQLWSYDSEVFISDADNTL